MTKPEHDLGADLLKVVNRALEATSGAREILGGRAGALTSNRTARVTALALLPAALKAAKRASKERPWILPAVEAAAVAINLALKADESVNEKQTVKDRMNNLKARTNRRASK